MKNVVVLVLLGCSAMTTAGEYPKAAYELAGGISVPAGPDDFSAYWTAGPHVSAGISYPSNTMFSGLFLLDWNSHAVQGDRLLRYLGTWYGQDVQGLTLSGARVTVFSATVNLKVSLGSEGASSLPYLLAGIGLYRGSASETRLSGPGGRAYLPSTSETAVAVQFGLGVNIRASDALSIFVDGRYLVGFTTELITEDATSSFPIRVGIRTR